MLERAMTLSNLQLKKSIVRSIYFCGATGESMGPAAGQTYHPVARVRSSRPAGEEPPAGP
jgi:hypothetical protein